MAHLPPLLRRTLACSILGVVLVLVLAGAAGASAATDPYVPARSGRLPIARRVALSSVAKRVDRAAPALTPGGAGAPRGGRARPRAGARSPGIFVGPVFRGLDSTQCMCAPPDVQIGAGPKDLIEMVNTQGEIVTRGGHVIARFPLSDLFGTGNDDVSDPRVIFDARSGRWLVALMDVLKSSFVVGISAGADPMQGVWHFEEYFTNTHDCLDQPTLGVTESAVFVTTELFTGTCEGPDGGGPVGGILVVLNKADLLAGSSSQFQAFGPDTTFRNIAAPQSLTPTDTEYLASVKPDDASAVHVSPYVGAPPTGGFGQPRSIFVSRITDPPPIFQGGNNGPLDPAIDNRIADSSWQNGRLYLTANESCAPAGGSFHQTCVRALVLDTARWVLAGDAEVGAPREDDFYGAMRPDAGGHVNIVYGYIADRGFPGLAANTFTGAGFSGTRILVRGRSPSTSDRYGDYFGAAVDPNDPRIVWLAGEYGRRVRGDTGGWNTAVAATSAYSRVFPPPAPPRAGLYRGVTAQRHSVRLRVAGGRLTRFVSVLRLACAKQPSVGVSLNYLSATHNVAIAGRGHFAFDGLTGHGRRVDHGRVRISGTFDGGSADGSMSGALRLRAGGVCRTSGVAWKAG